MSGKKSSAAKSTKGSLKKKIPLSSSKATSKKPVAAVKPTVRAKPKSTCPAERTANRHRRRDDSSDSGSSCSSSDSSYSGSSDSYSSDSSESWCSTCSSCCDCSHCMTPTDSSSSSGSSSCCSSSGSSCCSSSGSSCCSCSGSSARHRPRTKKPTKKPVSAKSDCKKCPGVKKTKASSKRKLSRSKVRKITKTGKCRDGTCPLVRKSATKKTCRSTGACRSRRSS
ncbi:keratin-associated protein 5-8-like isoform X1 [Physella acuta]|uniref:keratin-associated protein 5-8-like isoform X1 n=1 Tax=Physella acuta TaxID=109671 RepID=UPI0027DD9FB1|nr:keratin-associated protein 5-8-like isoform X1 [Physella acuta]